MKLTLQMCKYNRESEGLTNVRYHGLVSFLYTMKKIIPICLYNLFMNRYDLFLYLFVFISIYPEKETYYIVVWKHQIRIKIAFVLLVSTLFSYLVSDVGPLFPLQKKWYHNMPDWPHLHHEESWSRMLVETVVLLYYTNCILIWLLILPICP